MANMDRRVKYTKALLQNALVELMQTQHISRISVKELCEKADVHRSTFYVHYADPGDLLAQIERDVLGQVKAYLQEMDFTTGHSITVQKINRILEYGKENAALLQALFSENSDLSFQYDIMKSLDIISLVPDRVEDERTKEYIVLFGINGCLSMISKWLQDGMLEPTMQMAELMVRVLFQGMVGI